MVKLVRVIRERDASPGSVPCIAKSNGADCDAVGKRMLEDVDGVGSRKRYHLKGWIRWKDEVEAVMQVESVKVVNQEGKRLIVSLMVLQRFPIGPRAASRTPELTVRNRDDDRIM